jgi:HEAT repeat protein
MDTGTLKHHTASVLDGDSYSDGITTMNAIPTQEEWMVVLKKYAAATGLDKFPADAGASEDQLAAAEGQLKIKLPPSYRTFLSACNGWKFAADITPIIRPVEKIRWFRKEHKDWYEAYQMSAEPLSVMEKDYFDYANQDCAVFEIKHFAQALCISEIGDDAVVLLNPMVVWPDGEWETWFFSNSSPGATRYRSFADWMSQELDQSYEQFPTSGELPTVYLDAPTKPDRRIRPREKVLVLENILKKLKSKKESERTKATDQLGRLGGKQAVDALIAALNDPECYVRWHAASSLGLLHPPEALEALITAAADGVFGKANDNAIGALAAYNDERSAQLLLKILETGGYYAGVAGYALAKRGDARAIKPMLDSLVSKAEDSRAIWHTLTEFEGAGYEVLEPLMAHPDVVIRKRVEACIGSLAHHAKNRIIRRKAFELLQRHLTTETDKELRQSIEISIKISAKKNLNTR